MATHHSLKTITSLLEESWKLYKKHINVLALISVIPLVFRGVIIALGPIDVGGIETNILISFTILMLVFGLLYLIFAIVSPVALVDAVGDVHGGRYPSASEAYKKAVSLFFPYLTVFILSLLVVVGGFALFIIPGIVISTYVSLTIFVFLFEEKRGFDALVKSAWYVRHFWWDILARHVISVMIYTGLFIVFSFVVGTALYLLGFNQHVYAFLRDLFIYLGLAPFTVIYSYLVYKDIKEVKGHSEPDHAFVKEADQLFVMFTVLGCLVALFTFFVITLYPPRPPRPHVYINQFRPHTTYLINSDSGEYTPIGTSDDAYDTSMGGRFLNR